MRVLVTRPEAAGRETARLLAGRGFEPVLLPLTRPLHDIDAARQALRQPHWALAISSAEAARAAAPLLPEHPDLSARPLFAVGPASAEAARQAGFTNVIAAQGEGHSLADLIATHQQASAQNAAPLLYLAGNPRSPRFEARLAAHRLDVTVCEIYRMLPIDYVQAELDHLLGRNPVDIVLLYSAESAKRLTEIMLPDRLRQSRIVCLSDNIMAVLPQELQARAQASATPDEAALLALI